MRSSVRLGRQSVELLAKAREGNDRDGAAELCLAEDEREHRDEDVLLGQDEKPRHFGRPALQGIVEYERGAVLTARLVPGVVDVGPGASLTIATPSSSVRHDSATSAASPSTTPAVAIAIRVIACSVPHLVRPGTRGRLERERHPGRRPVTGSAVDLDLAAVGLDDSVDHREAEPDALALLLRGEERVEDLRRGPAGCRLPCP